MQPLHELAYNLRWTWNHDSIDLFRRLDPDLWETTGHNPVAMLGEISQHQLEDLAQDEGFLLQLERVSEQLKDFMAAPTWYGKQYGAGSGLTVAYFSAEYGINECMPIYSGGLGILAGCTLKAAAELGLPFVGVGLMYQVGYFRQVLDVGGWQGELYPVNDFYRMPCRLVRREDGVPVTIRVGFPGRMVAAQIWEAQVGRVRLYLLDTNVEENSPEDRTITSELYGGDVETRIQQEIVLGIGGVQALHELDIHPAVYHMNEGHSAFMALERARRCMESRNVPFEVALEATRAGNLFTTHTPVPAGIDLFSPELMDKYFGGYYPSLGISRKDFLALGRENPNDKAEPFSMAVLAFRAAASANGVSRLHGEVSRKMWQLLWPGVPEDEIPISHVTNGIHPRSWISAELAELFDRYLGRRWVEDPADQTVWERIDRIPAEELWRTHERRRERLVAFARRRLRQQLVRRQATMAEIERAEEVLNPGVLTIGFARRFATYKRADLLLHDPERLARIVSNEERPVQIIFSGKAHPKDTPGKELIRQLIQLIKEEEEFRRHIVFIDDYDMAVCRYMVQGVDLWLNTPRRLYEASGTSGMKASLNGALNMSILDGWWDEAYQPGIGWAIGKDRARVGASVLRSWRGWDAAPVDSVYEGIHAGNLPGVQHDPDDARVHNPLLPACGCSLPAPH
jgi:starch phosphorylase